jgi:hypothetical protein
MAPEDDDEWWEFVETRYGLIDYDGPPEHALTFDQWSKGAGYNKETRTYEDDE